MKNEKTNSDAKQLALDIKAREIGMHLIGMEGEEVLAIIHTLTTSVLINSPDRDLKLARNKLDVMSFKTLEILERRGWE